MRSSYLDELGSGSGQQVERAGKLPEEVFPGLPTAGAPHPLQELLQAGTGLDTSGPVEATQRGACRGREGDAVLTAFSQGGPVLSTSEPLTTGLGTCCWFPRQLARFWAPLWVGRGGEGGGGTERGCDSH